MKTREDYIRQFHEAFNLDIDQESNLKLVKLRRTLIAEETKELLADLDSVIEFLEKGEMVPKDLWVNMLKEMADVQVVVSGTAVSLKPVARLEEAFKRVHESNMSKLGLDGKPLYREDGKVMKGPNYFPPDLADLV